MKWIGKLDDLERIVKNYNWKSERDKGNISLKIVTQNGMIINFYESTKNLQIQGKQNDNDIKILNKILEVDPVCSEFVDSVNNKIYIVHGHDENSKRDLENILMKWGLEPIVSQDQCNMGKTVLEGVLEDIEKCSYGLVLLTPDDMGYAKKDGQEKLAPRARQNVIFEFGLLMGKMPKKIAILRKADTEIPTDMQGLLYISFGEKVDEVKEKLRKELKGSNIKLKD